MAQCSNINRRKLQSKLESERLQHNENTTEQHGDTELTPVKESSAKELGL